MIFLHKKNTLFIKLFIICILCFCSLFNTTANSKTSIFSTPKVIVNPNGLTPLSAMVTFSTQRESKITLKVYGQRGARDIIHTFEGYKKDHSIPVLGLYAGRDTKIELIALNKNGKEEKRELQISIPKIPWKGLYLYTKKDKSNPTNWFISDGIVIDENADVRYIFVGHGNRVLLSGNEIITENRVQGLKRYSMVGELFQSYSFPKGFTSFTHGMTQRPNRNFLVIGSYKGTKAFIAGKEQQTQRDFIIEIDYKTGDLVNTWDVAKMLNPDRTALVQAGSLDYGLDDFCHLNSVQYLAEDDSVVCSCRSTGIFKFYLKDNKLAWLITPNVGLNKSGRDGKGPEISSKVPKAIDKNGNILSSMIQKGYKSHPNFKWPTSTHHARYWGKGLVSVFDNSGPVFDKKIFTTDESIASIYKVDEENMTAQHIFNVPQGCFSGPAGSVLFDKEKNIVTSFISQCYDKTYKGTSYGYIRSYHFDTQEMLSEILVHKGGASYFYEIWPFEFYQTFGGML